jgi:hypothetical protein
MESKFLFPSAALPASGCEGIISVQQNTPKAKQIYNKNYRIKCIYHEVRGFFVNTCHLMSSRKDFVFQVEINFACSTESILMQENLTE